MKCLRCGHCCINYDVVILIDPDKGLTEENVEHKPSGVRCRHLQGDTPGKFACAIHEHPLYKKTPCWQFTQVESNPNTPCRIGQYKMKEVRT